MGCVKYFENILYNVQKTYCITFINLFIFATNTKDDKLYILGDFERNLTDFNEIKKEP